MDLRNFDLYGIVISVPKEAAVRFFTIFCLFMSAVYADCRISPVVTLNGDVHRIGVVIGKDRILYGGIISAGQKVFVRYEVVMPFGGGDVISSSERNVPAVIERVDVVHGLTLLRSATPPEVAPIHLGDAPTSGQAIRWFLSRRAGYALGKFSPSVVGVMPSTLVLDEASRALVGVVSNGRFISVRIIKTFLGVRLGRIPFFVLCLYSRFMWTDMVSLRTGWVLGSSV